jgi:hypothetical protein
LLAKVIKGIKKVEKAILKTAKTGINEDLPLF